MSLNPKRSVQPSHAFAASKASEDCLAGSFVCREDRTCISPDLVCDRKYDCADQTDEKTCGELNIFNYNFE
uniref:Low-density lipoprotein receptor domain class A n=1 Tax=Meloidogyne hapla TaxID=6305 RepID=A0A1I8BFG0_MELHA